MVQKKLESQFIHLHHKVMFLSVFDFTLVCFKFYTCPRQIPFGLSRLELLKPASRQARLTALSFGNIKWIGFLYNKLPTPGFSG